MTGPACCPLQPRLLPCKKSNNNERQNQSEVKNGKKLQEVGFSSDCFVDDDDYHRYHNDECGLHVDEMSVDRTVSSSHPPSSQQDELNYSNPDFCYGGGHESFTSLTSIRSSTSLPVHMGKVDFEYCGPYDEEDDQCQDTNDDVAFVTMGVVNLSNRIPTKSSSNHKSNHTSCDNRRKYHEQRNMQVLGSYHAHGEVTIREVSSVLPAKKPSSLSRRLSLASNYSNNNSYHQTQQELSSRSRRRGSLSSCVKWPGSNNDKNEDVDHTASTGNRHHIHNRKSERSSRTPEEVNNQGIPPTTAFFAPSRRLSLSSAPPRTRVLQRSCSDRMLLPQTSRMRSSLINNNNNNKVQQQLGNSTSGTVAKTTARSSHSCGNSRSRNSPSRPAEKTTRRRVARRLSALATVPMALVKDTTTCKSSHNKEAANSPVCISGATALKAKGLNQDFTNTLPRHEFGLEKSVPERPTRQQHRRRASMSNISSSHSCSDLKISRAARENHDCHNSFEDNINPRTATIRTTSTSTTDDLLKEYDRIVQEFYFQDEDHHDQLRPSRSWLNRQSTESQDGFCSATSISSYSSYEETTDRRHDDIGIITVAEIHADQSPAVSQQRSVLDNERNQRVSPIRNDDGAAACVPSPANIVLDEEMLSRYDQIIEDYDASQGLENSVI